MNCKEIEREIYLYRELTDSQKSAIDTHVAGCAACKKLFSSIQKYQLVVNGLAGKKSEPSNHSRLTSNIMQAIAEQGRQTPSWLNNLFIKYAMVAASLLLITFFGIEQMLPIEPSYNETPERTVTLNSASISEVLQSRKVKKNASLYVCLKTGTCTNAVIENFKQKKF